MSKRKPERYSLKVAARMLKMSQGQLVHLIKRGLIDANLQPIEFRTRISRDALIEVCMVYGIGLGCLDYGYKNG